MAPVARAVPETQVAREGLEDQATREDRAVPGVREGLEDRVARAVPAARVVPGDPEEDRVDPAGTNDPALSAGGLLPMRECKSRLLANSNHSFRITWI